MAEEIDMTSPEQELASGQETQNQEQSSSVEITSISNIDTFNDPEQRELASIFEKMKEFEQHESGNTNESIHRKYLRFTMEKEFVEMLSNPQYLHHLAVNNYFDDARFLAYLDYLQYWHKPEYAKCIEFVHSLRFLELLQIESFRKKLKEPNFKELVHSNQFWHWKHYRANRHWAKQTKELEIRASIQAMKDKKTKQKKLKIKNKNSNDNSNTNTNTNTNV